MIIGIKPDWLGGTVELTSAPEDPPAMSNARAILDDFEDAVLEAIPAIEPDHAGDERQVDARWAVGAVDGHRRPGHRGHFNGNERYARGLMMVQHSGYGGKWRLQLHAKSTRTSTCTTRAAQYIVSALPTLEKSFAYGRAALGVPLDDPLIKEAPHYLWFAGFKYASFTLTFTQCQDLYWQLGRIVLGDYVEFPYNPDHGMSFGAISNHEHGRSRGMSLDSRPAARANALRASMFTCTSAERAAWKDFTEAITNRTVGVSLFPGAGGRLERDHVDVMALKQNDPNTVASPAFNESNFELLGDLRRCRSGPTRRRTSSS
jgi:hypothetical protein